MNHADIIESTRRWISAIVIGLNLCPFAKRVFDAGLIRYAVSDADSEHTLLDDFTRELQWLASTPISAIETTLLIHPHALTDFLDFNDFLDRAERKIEELGLDGVIQIASFHPRYQFADTKPDDVENYTNRSPYPMLHLLREESITRIAAPESELLEIPERNIATLRALGLAGVLKLLAGRASDG
ncbi:MAG: DUF1415 domain-containing protein [Planctomycetes bacterium]|nr:DUF1415 domain-containing protein [Planctomycetota bacterium]